MGKIEDLDETIRNIVYNAKMNNSSKNNISKQIEDLFISNYILFFRVSIIKTYHENKKNDFLWFFYYFENKIFNFWVNNEFYYICSLIKEKETYFNFFKDKNEEIYLRQIFNLLEG